MCEEESDDAEAVNKLLEINDSIHRTIERYKLMKAGKVTAANSIPKGTLGTSTGVSRNAANELSLIDFDPEPAQEQPSTTTQSGQNGSLLEDTTSSASGKQTGVEDDLLGLSLGGASSSGAISLGGSNLSDLFNSPLPTAASPQPPQYAQSSFVAPAAASGQSSRPNYDAFSSLSSALPRSKPATPTPGQQRPTQQATASSDPFASLISSGSRPSTPSMSMQQNGARPASGSFHPPSGLPNAMASQSSSVAPSTTTDDDWNFVSSPPTQEPALPPKSTLTVHDQGKLKVILECMRQTNQGSPASAPIFVKASYTNQTNMPITGLHFQIAVEKAYHLQLQPQSGKDLPPHQASAVSQNMLVSNVPPGKGTAVKIRFKASYTLGGSQQEEQGMATSLGIA